MGYIGIDVDDALELPRVQENGYRIKMVQTEDRTVGVDTPKDLNMASEAVKKGELYRKYERKQWVLDYGL